MTESCHANLLVLLRCPLHHITYILDGGDDKDLAGIERYSLAPIDKLGRLFVVFFQRMHDVKDFAFFDGPSHLVEGMQLGGVRPCHGSGILITEAVALGLIHALESCDRLRDCIKLVIDMGFIHGLSKSQKRLKSRVLVDEVLQCLLEVTLLMVGASK